MTHLPADYSLTDEALASTIVPIHSDASASTSVTASPMELLEPLDPAIELKIPLPEWEGPRALDLDGLDKAAIEGTPTLEAAMTEIPPSSPGPVGLPVDHITESNGEVQLGGEHQESELVNGEQPTTQGPAQGESEPTEHYRQIRLRDLKDVTGLDCYHKNQTLALQDTLYSEVLADGLNRRLLPSLSSAYQAMADCYQNGDQAGFANLYQTCEDFLDDYTGPGTRSLNHGNPSPLIPDGERLTRPHWFGQLPHDCQEDLLDFLSRLRTDPNFLAERLAALSLAEFAEFCNSPYRPQDSISVFGIHHNRMPSGFSGAPSLPGDRSPLERLRRLHEGDPFFVLFHSVFDSSSLPGTYEYHLRTRVWSTACAKIITQGRPGSDELTIATLNAFCHGSTWSLVPQMETLIGKMLQDGAFLLTPAAKGSTADSKEPLEIRNANAAIATSNFFDRALKELFAVLLGSSPAAMMPDGLLGLIHAILQGITYQEVRTRARNFIVSKWYISSFLGRVLTYPEHYGMMMSNHIGSNVRKAIFKEITNKLLKQVFDVQFTWKSSVPILDPEIHGFVEQLLSRFDSDDPASGESSPHPPCRLASGVHSLILNAHDAAGLIRSLVPAVTGSPLSANPSTAGSSTLVSGSVLNGVNGPNRSKAPSLSGMSTLSTPSLPTENPQPWKHYKEPVRVGSDKDMTSLPFENAGDRLIRLHERLAALARPKSQYVDDVSTMDWVLFAVDKDGNVGRQPAYGRSKEDRSALSEPDLIAESARDSTTELRLGIMQLLARENPTSGYFRSSLRSGEGETEGVDVGLNKMISSEMDRATVNYDYQGMHYWWRMQRLLKAHQDLTDSLFQSIFMTCKESISTHIAVSESVEQQLYSLASSRGVQVAKIRKESKRRKALRTKMWYAADVRHSSTFEDALHVTQALRSMAVTSRAKQSSGVANWARQRLKNVSWHDRSTAQTVEALTEPNEYSGTCKLNDDQVERTTRWLTRQSIENFCRGEERIQRFCFEVQRCMNKLTGPTLLDSPVLWSSRLFEREKRLLDRKSSGTKTHSFPQPIDIPPGGSGHQPLSYWAYPQLPVQAATVDLTKNRPGFYSASPKEPVRSLPVRGPHVPLTTPDAIWLSSSPGNAARNEMSSNGFGGPNAPFTAEIKKELCSLMLSDLGYLLWHDGTETDAWVKLSSTDADLPSLEYQDNNREPCGGQGDQIQVDSRQTSGKQKSNLESLLLDASNVIQDSRSRWQPRQAPNAKRDSNVPLLESEQDPSKAFPYKQTYKGILERFSLSQDPQTKLRLLEELEHLVSHSIQYSMSPSRHTKYASEFGSATGLSRSQSILVPRTKATSFEEVIANCTERRAGTMRFNKSPVTPSTSPDTETFGTDEIVSALLSIFRDVDLRPSTLFRDLQYIAAFVPAEMLDHTPQGKAFWDTGLAALALKQELCDAMISRATDITNYHISAISSDPAASPAAPLALRNRNSFVHTTLQDAAHLWVIAAKEGSATAARELGLLYLTHPEILPRTILQPFSKPKEVFRMVGGARKEGASTTAMEEGRLDPVTFAVVFHWMEVAANGGDKDARDFLRGNGEWGVGR